MAIRFTSEFRSDTGIDYKIEIDDSLFVGSSTTFKVAAEGFVLEYAGETDDIVSPIMSSNVSVPFLVESVLQETFFEQLVAVQESRFRLKISRYDSGSYKTYWVGYIMQDIAQIEDVSFPYIYDLRAVDGLGRLANIDYTFANNVFQNSLAITRLNKIVYNCLYSIGTTDLYASTDTFLETCVNWWEDSMSYATNKDVANEIAVDRRIWSSIDGNGDEVYTKIIEVLRQLCVTFGARVYQSNGRFIFEQYGERAAATRIVSTYDRSGTYIATTSKSDDVTIDQTIAAARLAGNQFDFLPAIKRCEVEFNQKFVGSRLGQLYFTNTRSTPQVFGFISSDSNAVLELVAPMMHFYINRTPNTTIAVPSGAIVPIFKMNIKIEDVNNPGTFYYFQRSFNGYNNAQPYTTPVWTTTNSDYEFDAGNFKFTSFGTAGVAAPVTIQTDQLPVSGELTFQLKPPTLRYVATNAVYVSPPLYTGLPTGAFITYDFLANVDYVSSGQLTPESIVYRASNGNTRIESNLVLSLGSTSVADGPLQTGNLAIFRTAGVWGASDNWRKGNSGSYKKILQLLVTEALALHAKPIRRYNGSFYSSHDISRRFTFDLYDWLFIGGRFTANTETIDGEFFAIARDVSDVVDLNNDFIGAELAPMNVNKVSGPNSFGGVFTDGSIAGMLVDSETTSVGPFSEPTPGNALITGTTTIDGDANFTQDVEVTGNLIVDGTIVIDGLGDVATEQWVIDQGYLTAESDTLDSVTDRGNTTTNTINVGGVTTDYVLFDTTATPTPSLGMAYWNTDEGTVSLQVNGVAYELGQKEAWIVKNQTGATITKGTVVMAVGALGASARILAGKMVADGTVSPRFLLGVAAENITNGSDGRVIHRGKLRQFNTSAFAVGDVLFCDPTTPGALTNVEPQAPNLKLPIAFVLSSGTNGSLAIRITTGNRLSEDHDVQLSTLSTGQLLRYNSNRWENWTPNFLTTSNVSGTTNYVSKFTGANTVGDSQIIDNGTNVGIGTASPSQKLHVNGSARITGSVYDSSNSAGTSGQVLSSTGTGTQWVAAGGGGGSVSSVFGRTGAVVATSGDYTTAQVTESGNLYYTEARVNANTNVAANTAARHNAVTIGTANGLSLSTQVLSLGLASSSANGALSSTDWSTFNSKQNALTNPVTGTGTSNYLSKFTGTGTIGNSQLYDNGTSVGIGTISPSAKLHVIGNATVSATLSTANAKISGTLADSLNQVGTAGQVLSSTGTGIEWVAAGGGGGGSTIIVKDEGTTIGSSFTTLNFVGNNIEASASSSTAVITAFNNAGTGSNYVDGTSTNFAIPSTWGDVEIDSAFILVAAPDTATGSSKLVATVTFGVENVSSFEGFNNFQFRLYDVSQSVEISNTTHTWTNYMSKDEGATRTVFTFHIPLTAEVIAGDEIRVQAQQGVSYTPEIYFCSITLMEGTQ